MGNKVKGLIVTFEVDVDEEVVGRWIAAISLLKNVVDVCPVVVRGSDLINRTRIRHELQSKLLDLLQEDPDR